MPPVSVDPRARHLSAELAAEGAALDAAEGRSAALIDEADPRTTVDLLADWERVAGLPDTCVIDADGDLTPAQRRAALVARLTAQGGQSPPYFVALAAALGYAVTITEFHLHTVEDDVEYGLYDGDWIHTWQVNAAVLTVFDFRVEDTVDDPIAWWGNNGLICIIRRYKPAHTAVLFDYS